MGKGETTRSRILDRAIAIASVEGITGLTIGTLAERVGMSKSGLFAHFQSRDELQLQVVDEAGARFTDRVIRPAQGAPAGEPRIRAFFERWLAWLDDQSMPGGCVLLQATAELDDRPGPAQERLVVGQRRLRDFIADLARRAVDAGQFSDDLDPALFAFQLQGIILARQHAARLLRDRGADARSRQAFEALVDSVRS